MQKYKCHKEVHASKITSIGQSGRDYVLYYDENQRYVVVSGEYVEKHEPQAGGYYVMYADGYESYSPAGAFEDGYTAMVPPTLDGASPIMQHFSYEHLPQHLKTISQQVCELAFSMDDKLKCCPEKSAGLRKLLEAKDCLVRAAIK